MSAFRPRYRVVVLLSAVASAIFLLSASQAFASVQINACVNPVVFTETARIPVTTTANASPNPVAPKGSVTLGEIHQELEVPSAVFAKGYQLGYLELGDNEVPVKLVLRIIGTNTVEGEQIAEVDGLAKTTISGTKEKPVATPGIVSVTYPNQTWTASETGKIEFREKTVEPLKFPSLKTPTEAGLKIIAEAGAIVVPFDCSPGQVEESAEPSTIKYEQAAPFASATIKTEGGGGGGVKPGTAFAPRVAKVKGGKALLKLRCRGGGPCKGLVKLQIGRKLIGKARFSIAAGKAKTVRVKLNGRGKKLLRHARRHRLKTKLGGRGVKKRTVLLKG
jgi:hypothetical protein